MPTCVPLALLLVLTLAHTAAAQPTSSTQDDRAEQLLSCLPKDCAGRRTVWDHMLQHTPPCIGGQGVWYTKHKPRLPITLVTQLSSNRLQALQAQCQSWAGPLAAAVFVPLFNPGPASSKELSLQSKQRLARAVAAVEEVMTWAEDLAQRTQATAAALSAGQDLATLLKDIPQNASARDRPRASCQLSIILLYEVYQQEKALALYPVNSLRNYARLLADTPLIANIDVDMLPSLSLSAALLKGWTQDTTAEEVVAGAGRQTPSPGSAAELLLKVQKERAVFVLPAFETTCGGPALADQVSAYTKPQLQTIMAENCTIIFRYLVMPQCHNATDFDRWFSLPSQPSDGAVPYKISYGDSFEPWFIGARDQTEWFDIRYRGYGKNKIEQVAQQAHKGSVFYVHPTGFLIHRPHDQSQARKTFLRVKFKSKHNAMLLQNSLYQHVEDMWEKHAQEIKAGQFQTLVDDQLAQCVRTLPWWQGLHR